MERSIDPLLTIDAKLWADEFMATKQRLGDAEFDHAMMLGWFANAIMRGYDEGRRLGPADAQATIAALQARVQELEKNRDKPIEQVDPRYWDVNELRANVELKARHIDEIQAQLTQRTAELEALRPLYDDMWKQFAESQAELERVRGELVEATHNANVYQSLYSTGCMDRALLENDLRELRTLILALPKVEGEVTVRDITALYWASDGTYGSIDCKEQMVSLLQERQKLC